jgi:hypothetical protein
MERSKIWYTTLAMLNSDDLSETLVYIYQTTWRHMQVDRNLNVYTRKNLRSHGTETRENLRSRGTETSGPKRQRLHWPAH